MGATIVGPRAGQGHAEDREQSPGPVVASVRVLDVGHRHWHPQVVQAPEVETHAHPGEVLHGVGADGHSGDEEDGVHCKPPHHGLRVGLAVRGRQRPGGPLGRGHYEGTSTTRAQML
jgi:hypothetical protein